MFILIGYMAFHARLTQGAFYCMRMWFGHLPGGLAIATVFATAAFAAVSGASTATAAVFSRIAIPEMLRYGYPPGFSAGVVAAGGTLASLIPPSGILVIYAIIVEESVGKLLMAGFIPGILSAIIYAGSIMVRVKLNPELAGDPIGKVTMKDRFASMSQMWGILFVVFIIMGGVYSGWMTPTESGAIGALRRVHAGTQEWHEQGPVPDRPCGKRQDGGDDHHHHLGHSDLGRFLGFSDLPNVIKDEITSLGWNRYWILLIILLMYAVLGMFMDAIGMLLLTLPLGAAAGHRAWVRPDLVRHHRRENGGDLLDYPTDWIELFRCGWGQTGYTSRIDL